MTRLWDAKHSYYCEQQNYFARGDSQPTSHYKSLADFLSEEDDADLDYNLLFRWDWQEGEDYDLAEYNGDDNYRNGLLRLFFMGQRKGLYRSASVEVCRSDEPKVREYLAPRYRHLVGLWSPISEGET